jgi:hypothetical protein
VRRVALMLLVVAAVAAAGGLSYAAFSDQAQNSGNSFGAASSFGGTWVVTGSYTGNGVDNRAVSGLPFEPEAVMVKAATAETGVFRTSTMTGDSAKLFSPTGNVANRIQSLTASGFTLGDSVQSNQNGTTYHWVAFNALGGRMQVGTYAGNGSAQTVTGAGFSPEYVIVAGQGGQAPQQRSATMTGPRRFDNVAAGATGVTALAADGFSVGAHGEANNNGAVYHWIAWNATPGLMDAKSYVGNGVRGRSISAGFGPHAAFVKSNSEGVTANRGVFKVAANASVASQYFANVASGTNQLEALEADGFQVGSGGEVNTNAATYHWMAFRDALCSSPGTQTLTASSDSWIDEANPGTNNGGDSTLALQSSSAANRRVMVNFTMPALPAGCAVTDARLRVYNTAPTPGRTLTAASNAASWTEGGVTWSNQPATAGYTATAVTPASEGWMEWPVTGLVGDQYSNALSFGFRLRDEAEGDATPVAQTLISRESSANQPELVVSFG